MEITEALKVVHGKINNSALKAGRNPQEITLVAVTKTVESSRIIEAIEAGLRIFGENRVQEAQKKVMSDELRVMSDRIEWHLVGHLQTNKAKTAVQLFDLIHSVDSLKLAEEVNKQAEKIGKIQRVLVQVKLSEEETRHGISESDLILLLERIRNLNNLKLEGLMSMPPFFEDPEEVRPYFKKLREIRDRAMAMGYTVAELSMGMSNDFEVAIEEGATMVRIGTAIFGERKL